MHLPVPVRGHPWPGPDPDHAEPAGLTVDAGARNETRGTILASRVEHAESFFARFMGLMGRPGLAPGTALWLHGNGIHMFFMRFAIDAVFLGAPAADGSRRVVSIHRNVRPWVGMVPFVRGAAGVLELPVGAIETSDTIPGDNVRLA